MRSAYRFTALLALLWALGSAPPLIGLPARAETGAPAAQQSLYVPKFESDLDRVRFLIWAKDHVPSLFSLTSAYNVDLFRLVEDEAKLVELLKNNSEYLKAVSERPPLLSMTLHEGHEKTVKSFVFRPEQVSALRSELQEALRTLPTEGSVGDALIEAIAREVKAIGVRTSANLAVGLIQLLPGEFKAAALRARTFEEKLALIRQHLPEPLPASFKFQVNGFTSMPKASEAVAELSRLEGMEKRLADLAALYGLSLAPGGSAAATRAELEKRVGSASVEELDLLHDKDALNGEFERLEQVLAARNVKTRKSELGNRMRERMKTYSIEGEKKAVTYSKGFTVREVPPTLGIFRGCSGGDCSSSYSFPYPNDPNERVYFIADESGRLKGYVQGTIVDVDGKRTFYLNTVTGSRVSTEEAKIVIHAFDRNKDRLGVTQLVLPRESTMSQLINYTPITQVFRNYVEGGKEVDIAYPSKDIRSEIEGFSSNYNSGGYDRMNAHPKAILPAATLDRKAPPFKVEVGQYQIAPFQTRQVTKRDALELALDIDHGGVGSVQQALDAAGVGTEDYEHLRKTLSNFEGHPIAQFEEEARAALLSLGLDEPALKEKAHLLNRGRFSAPDALAPENRARTLKSLMDEFKIDIEARDAGSFLRAHAEEIGKEEIFKKTFITILKETVDNNQQPSLMYLLAGIPNLDREFAPFLVPYALDDYSAVSGPAANLLERMNPLPAEAVALIEAGERGPDPQIRDRARTLLERLGPPPLPPEACAGKFEALAAGVPGP